MPTVPSLRANGDRTGAGRTRPHGAEHRSLSATASRSPAYCRRVTVEQDGLTTDLPIARTTGRTTLCDDTRCRRYAENERGQK